MRNAVLTVTMMFFFLLAGLLLAMSGGMMDRYGDIAVSLKLAAASISSLIAGAGFGGWRT